MRNGDVVTFPAGGIAARFGFNNWRLQPPVPITDASPASLKPTFKRGQPAPGRRARGRRRLQVAAFNVFNYFTTLTSQKPAARGAATAADFAIQKSKIVAAINGLDADVVALQEIENSIKLGEPPDEALADLVAGLNAAAGCGSWDYVRTPAALHDAGHHRRHHQRDHLQARRREPVGRGADADRRDRVGHRARADRADLQVRQAFVTVVANHFKSKSGTDPTRRPRPGPVQRRAGRAGAGAARVRRTASSDGPQERDVFLVGDFNAYAQEDPIQVFTDAGWTDLLSRRPRPVHLHVRRRARLARPRDRLARGGGTVTGGGLGDQLARVGRARVRVRARRGGHAVPLERPRPDHGRRRQPSVPGHGRHRAPHRERLPRSHRAVRALGRHRRAVECGQAVRAANPNTIVRRRRRHDRRIDVHVVHPAGPADDRRAQRDRPRRRARSATTSSTRAARTSPTG